MKESGMEMDEKYFTERTGIPAKRIVEPAPGEGDLEVGKPGEKPKDKKPNPDKIKNMMDDLYAKH
jgi:hypothetical protein